MHPNRNLMLLFFVLLPACATTTKTPALMPASPTPEKPDPPSAEPSPTVLHPSESTPTVEPFTNPGQIMFLVNKDGVNDVYIINADGTQLSGWPHQIEGLMDLDWSPDGSRLAIVGRGDGDDEIYVMNADGSGLTQLTNNSVPDRDPSWSPDGTRIAFYSMRDAIVDHEGPPPEIYVMNADGSQQTRITTNETSDTCPTWTPSGSHITFTSFHFSYQSSRINIMKADGSEETVLVDTHGDDGCPRWSPDGSRLVFESRQRDGNLIILTDAYGLNEVLLTDGSAADRMPYWSTDGQWIVFVSDRNGENDLYIISAIGSKPVNITLSPYLREYNPRWIPSGLILSTE